MTGPLVPVPALAVKNGSGPRLSSQQCREPVFWIGQTWILDLLLDKNRKEKKNERVDSRL